jgi:hypothetical protein
VKQWLADADGWTAWRSYKTAFAALGAGFAELALGVLAAKYDWMSRSIIPLAIPVLIAIGYATTMWLILGIYEVEENPWRTFFSRYGLCSSDPAHSGLTRTTDRGGRPTREKRNTLVVHNGSLRTRNTDN